MNLWIYLILMAGSTYLIRMLPFTLFRRKITSRFVKSFLYYVPYAVLSAMTFPAIFTSTGSIATSVFGTAVALVLAYFGGSLIVVSASAAAAALLLSFLL